MLYLVKFWLARPLGLGIDVNAAGKAAYTDYTAKKKDVDAAQAKVSQADQEIDAQDTGKATQDLSYVQKVLTQDSVRTTPADTAALDSADKLIRSGSPKDLKQAAQILKQVAEHQCVRLNEKLDALRTPSKAQDLVERENQALDKARQARDDASDKLKTAKSELADAQGEVKDKTKDVANIEADIRKDGNFEKLRGAYGNFNKRLADRVEELRATNPEQAHQLAHKAAELERLLDSQPADGRATLNKVQELNKLAVELGDGELARKFSDLLDTDFKCGTFSSRSLRELIHADEALTNANNGLSVKQRANTDAYNNFTTASRECQAEEGEAREANRNKSVADAYSDADSRFRDRLSDANNIKGELTLAQQELQRAKTQRDGIGDHDVSKAEKGLKDADGQLKKAEQTLNKAQEQLGKAQKSRDKAADTLDSKKNCVADIEADIRNDGDFQKLREPYANFSKRLADRVEELRATDPQKAHELSHKAAELERLLDTKPADGRATLAKVQELNKLVLAAGDAELTGKFNKLLNTKFDCGTFSSRTLSELASADRDLVTATQNLQGSEQALDKATKAVAPAQQAVDQATQGRDKARTTLDTAQHNQSDFERASNQFNDVDKRAKGLQKDFDAADKRRQQAETERNAIVPPTEAPAPVTAQQPQ